MIAITDTTDSTLLFDTLDWRLIERRIRETFKESEQPRHGQNLCCGYCRRQVTREDLRIPVQGSHQHVYSNPHGIVFEIGCFASASGCQAVGVPTEEWTWFRGFAWQIAICKGCGEHLGWRYSNTGSDTFFGLILGRLAS